MQGLEKACDGISKVDSIVARRSCRSTRPGQDKLKQSALDCSIVRITLPEADAGPFYTWFDDSVVKGKAAGNGPAYWNGLIRPGRRSWGRSNSAVWASFAMRRSR